MNIIIVVVVFIQGSVSQLLDENTKHGEVVFGHEGKVYKLDSNECSGGIVFKKPINPKFMCVNGFFLQRNSACSSQNERVIGAREYVCEDYTHSARLVQSVFLLTNPKTPLNHTVAVYDDEDLLTNLRRFDVNNDEEKSDEGDANTKFMIVSNPSGSDADVVKIGGVCYSSGGVKEEGGSYKVFVGNKTHETGNCTENSTVVHPADGVMFDRVESLSLTDSYLDDNGFEGNSVLRKRGLHPGDTVIIGLKGDKKGDEKYVTTDPSVVATEPFTKDVTEAVTPEIIAGTTVGVIEGVATESATEGVTQEVTEGATNAQTEETTQMVTEYAPLTEGVLPEGTTAGVTLAEGTTEGTTDAGEAEGSATEGITEAGTEGATGGTAETVTESVTDIDGIEPTTEVGSTTPLDLSIDTAGSTEDETPILDEDKTNDLLSMESANAGGFSQEEEERGGRKDDIGDLLKEASSEPKYSGEDDEVGSWENINSVLSNLEFEQVQEPNTLAYEGLVRGSDSVYKTPTNPLFESYVHMLKDQIKNIVGSCQEGLCDKTKLEDSQPQGGWYNVLARFVEVAKGLVPDEIVADEFFDTALQVFGYYGRAFGGKKSNNADVLEELLAECAKKAKNFSRQAFKVSRSEQDCGVVQLLSSSYDVPSWNENNHTYISEFKKSLYGLTNPKDHLPPATARINRNYWLFPEIIWYALQVSYAFCYDTFADVNPNWFMGIIWLLVDDVFGNQIVVDNWSSRRESGNLDTFEMILPYITHSAVVSPESNAEDFERVLTELDKISYVVHEGSVLNHWMRRPIGKEVEVGDLLPPGVVVDDFGDARGRGMKKKKHGRPCRHSRDVCRHRRGRRRRKRSPNTRRVRRNANNDLEVSTSPQTLIESKDVDSHIQKQELAMHEIWDGLAYCVNLNQGLNTSGLEPSLTDFKSNGVCLESTVTL